MTILSDEYIQLQPWVKGRKVPIQVNMDDGCILVAVLNNIFPVLIDASALSICISRRFYNPINSHNKIILSRSCQVLAYMAVRTERMVEQVVKISV